MSEFASGLEFIGIKDENTEKIIETSIESDRTILTSSQAGVPFDVTMFGNELERMSAIKNELKAQRAGNITGYDIAHNCIRQVLYKLLNTPVPNWADSWLPIYIRSTLGTAIHEFIQKNTAQLSEIELNLKIPSIGFYGKVDGVIGNDILVEIKSCPYSDYATIIRQQKPRVKDYLQAMCYAYIIENYCQEAKSEETEIHYGGDKPKLDSYNIKKLQFLYVAHDIIASDCEDLGEILENIKHTKRLLDSKKNQFFFITSLVIDLDDETKKECYKWIKDKIDAIRYYAANNILPKETDPFIKHDGCFFCQYSQICEIKKRKS